MLSNQIMQYHQTITKKHRVGKNPNFPYLEGLTEDFDSTTVSTATPRTI